MGNGVRSDLCASFSGWKLKLKIHIYSSCLLNNRAIYLYFITTKSIWVIDSSTFASTESARTLFSSKQSEVLTLGSDRVLLYSKYSKTRKIAIKLLYKVLKIKNLSVLLQTLTKKKPYRATMRELWIIEVQANCSIQETIMSRHGTKQ